MKTRKEIESLLAANDLAEYFDLLSSSAKNAIHMDLEAAAEADIPIGASKMGGLPDLPRTMAWFRDESSDLPMCFICQINFTETKPYDAAGKLPDHGILYFFYDGECWGFDPKDASGKVVYYYDGDLSQLERKEAPEDLEEDDRFHSARLSFHAGLDLPHPDSGAFDALGLPDDAYDKYWDLRDDSSDSLCNKLLGHSDNIQNDMELECELTSHGLYCGDSSGYEEGQKLGLDKNTGHWDLLLQVDSNEDLGMLWDDCGKLYFWITAEDLAARNFEKTWLILQCG